MPTYESNICSTARQQITTNPDGSVWEHFYLEGQYRFSNQIPNRESFTTADPGQLFYDRGQCRWDVDPQQQPGPQANQAGSAGETAVIGLIMVGCIAASGIYAWLKRKDTATDSDYHPMSDLQDLPVVLYNRIVGKKTGVTTGDCATTEDEDEPLEESTSDGQNESEPAGDKVIDAPWDDIDDNGATVAATVGTDRTTTPAEARGDRLDKLRGMSLKTFKDQLSKNNVSTENGSFLSVEVLKFPATETLAYKKMRRFWNEYASTRAAFAVYYLFGLQNGGRRSVEFTTKYEEATQWVKNWYHSELGHE